MSTDSVRIANATQAERMREIFTEDEDFRMPRIKLDRDKPRFHIAAPTKEDPEATESTPSFKGVIVLVRKNYYQSEEDKEEGKDPKEKRALYIVRNGKIMPEVLYISPTALRNWKQFVASLVRSGQNYYTVMTEFAAEQAHSKNTGYKWMKPTFKEVRTLTEEEQSQVEATRELVDARIREYESMDELDNLEEQALSGGKSELDPQETRSANAAASVEEHEEEDEPTAGDKPKRGRPAAAKKGNYPSDDDEDDPGTSKKSKAAPPSADDDDDDL